MRNPRVETNRLLPPSPANPRNSEGAFLDLTDGRIVLAWSRYYGGRGDHDAADIACRYSADGGRTWTDEDRILVPKEGRMNNMSVSLMRLGEGRIALFYLVKNSLDDLKLYLHFSDDELATLSDRTQVTVADGYHVHNNDRVVRLSTGRLLAPGSFHPHRSDATSQLQRHGVMRVFYSDDDGASWQQAPGEVVNNDVAMQEPGVVELRDGRVLMWMRTDAGVQYKSYSEDEGLTWRPAAPTDWQSPLSPAGIKRVPSTGDLLMAWNDYSQPRPNAVKDRPRNPLVAALSSDEAETWPRRVVLLDDPLGHYCYTAIHFVGDDVMLGHCDGTPEEGGLSCTSITRFPLSIFD